ncbi:MAG: hypothetical protein IT373_06130 [Polyangiaceae bacterium]|nr:hypothetical protein [Polyangiaceae bacterium]
MAADHRAAAQALVDAESRSCGGVAPEDRDTSPFYQREDVVRVEPSEAGGAEPPQSVTVVFRAVDGLSLEELQLVVDCHLARNASLGHATPEMSYCPLALEGVTADVAAGAAAGELAVTLRASDAATRGELWRRARALAP